MDRSLRIPDDIIDRLLTGLENTYRQKLSVGFPLPTDVDTNWVFPVFIQIQNVDTFLVLGLQQHFAYYGATVFDVTLSSLANQTALTFYRNGGPSDDTQESATSAVTTTASRASAG